MGGTITFRAVLIGLLLIPFNAWWLTQIEYVRYSDNATTSALFFNAIALLLFLLFVNTILHRFRPRWTFSRAELLTIYAMIVVASNIAGHDQLQILFTTLTYIVRYASPANGWTERISPLLPQDLLVTDRTAVNDLYYGRSTFYTPEHLRVWIEPLAWWSLFALVVAWVMLCMSTLLRRAWDAERLNYPIAEVPLQMTDPRTGLFRNRLFWLAFSIAASLQIINFLHFLYPTIPGIPIGVRYYYSNQYPWNAAGWIPISSFPFAYGLTFLLPLQLGFSCWFFFLFSRIELVVAAMFGHTEWNRFPYIQQQGVGAYFGIAILVLASARRYLQAIFLNALGRKAIGDAGEPLSYRTAFFGFLGGVAFLMAFAIHAGMRPMTTVIYFLLLLSVVLVVARLRAELGLPTIELYQVGADEIVQATAGTAAWSKGDLTVMTLFFWLTRTHRQFPMQSHVDSLRLGHRCPIRLRTLSLVIMLATAFGIICAFWAYLHIMYQVGYESAKFTGPALWAFGREPWDKLSYWITSPRPRDPGAIGAYIFGIGFTFFLAAMRSRFLWWPFHPAGYLVSGSFGLMRLWLPLFVSWLIKSLLLRYGGLKAYRKALPLFLGLVLGEFAAGFLRTVLDLIFNLHLPPESGIGGL